MYGSNFGYTKFDNISGNVIRLKHISPYPLGNTPSCEEPPLYLLDAACEEPPLYLLKESPLYLLKENSFNGGMLRPAPM
jgi:hypothetical protein